MSVTALDDDESVTMFARRWRDPATEREVTADEEMIVPDTYVAEYIDMTVDAVAFIETSPDRTTWTLWRCNGVGEILGRVALFTVQFTEKDAEQELRARGLPIPPPV